MGLIRTIALVILGFSSFVFVVLFGRLPFFRYGTIATITHIALSDEPRKTPIGFVYRLVWIHVPNGISYLDSRLFGGRVLGVWNRAGSYVLYENHPLVLVSFAFRPWLCIVIDLFRRYSLRQYWPAVSSYSYRVLGLESL